jgi:hypothetical protein
VYPSVVQNAIARKGRLADAPTSEVRSASPVTGVYPRM